MFIRPFVLIVTSKAQATVGLTVNEFYPQTTPVIYGVDVAVADVGFVGIDAQHGAVGQYRGHAVAVHDHAISGAFVDAKFLQGGFGKTQSVRR